MMLSSKSSNNANTISNEGFETPYNVQKTSGIEFKNSSLFNNIVVIGEPSSQQARSLIGLHGQIQRRFLDNNKKSLSILSDKKNNVASYVAANISVLCAISGLRTVLIDANLLHPFQDYLFGIGRSKVGFVDLLNDDSSVNRQRLDCGFYVLPKLYLIPAGDVQDKTMRLSNMRMKNVMSDIERYADVVIYDLPPALEEPEAIPFSCLSDGVLIATRRNYSKLKDIQFITEMIKLNNGKIEGFVMFDI